METSDILLVASIVFAGASCSLDEAKAFLCCRFVWEKGRAASFLGCWLFETGGGMAFALAPCARLCRRGSRLAQGEGLPSSSAARPRELGSVRLRSLSAGGCLTARVGVFGSGGGDGRCGVDRFSGAV